MADEPNQVVTPAVQEGEIGATPPAETTPTPSTEPVIPEPAAPPTWQELIDRADPRELRSHPRLAGIIGSENQRAIQEHERRLGEGAEAKRRAEAESAMMSFFDGNEEFIRQNHPKVAERFDDMRRERAQHEIDGLRGKTREELATAIGRAFNDLPEWQELTPADHEELARAVMGRPEDEIIPIFNRKVLDLLTDRRAQNRLTAWRGKELAKEREAIRVEEAAKLLGSTPAPDAASPKNGPAARTNVNAMSDKEFIEYARKQGLRV